MWALVENDSVVKVYTRPTAVNIGDNQYPSNIMQVWSASELEAIGIYEVVVDNSNLKDKEYYINTNQSFDFANGAVTASYGTATAKAIEDVTDDDDNVTKGLKSIKKEAINVEAGGILQPTDWMVIREADGGTAVPSNISTWRASVRTKANEMCTAIDNASDIDALITLYKYTNTGTEEEPVFTRPLGEFPELG